MTRTAISFASSPERTELLNSLLKPDEDTIRRLLADLSKTHGVTPGQIELEAKRLCKGIRLAATAEAFRRGWDRPLGRDKAIQQLEKLDRGLASTLNQLEKLPREALEALIWADAGEDDDLLRILLQSETGREPMAARLVEFRQRIATAIELLEQAESKQELPPKEPASLEENSEADKGTKRKVKSNYFMTLEERITFAAGVAYKNITGKEPSVTNDTGDGGKTTGPFVEFLDKLFKTLRLPEKTSAANQARKLRERRRQTQRNKGARGKKVAEKRP